MRIILIGGLGEDEFIFDRILDQLPGEQQVLSLWKLLPDHPVPAIQAAQVARGVANQYHITAKDVLIGHSAGGWLAIYIKQLVGCPVIQLSSWTDLRKVIVPVHNRHLVYFTARTGLYLNRLVLWWSLRNYRGLPSRPVFKKVFHRLLSGNRANAVNQLRLIFNPVPGGVHTAPDLRIHARGDRLIRFPDGPVEEVPGDHFSLWTNPEAVVASIRKFLATLYAPA